MGADSITHFKTEETSYINGSLRVTGIKLVVLRLKEK